MTSLRRSSRKRTADDSIGQPEIENASERRDASRGSSSKRAKSKSKAEQPLESTNGLAQINDDEAQLYDRQIRLWGMDAQTRMRNASVCVINLGALSTEVIKNIVLAGIGSLTIVDNENVSAKDLGAGFFFREEDLGQNRAQSAKDRIRDLNPRADLDTMLRVNRLCREQKVKFFAAGIYGLHGFAFADLLQHTYRMPNPAAVRDPSAPKDVRKEVQYHSVAEAIDRRWESMRDVRARDTARPKFYGILALLTYQQQHGVLPTTSDDDLARLAAIKDQMMTKANINPSFVSEELLRSLSSSASSELSPIASIAGGLLAQELLRAIGEKDPPMDNILYLDGEQPLAGIGGY
ncbi:hypothetical protein HDU93_007295 [Gonapodya sp. JEL0774]|nr:hypothetical protein HDU93_007295 [Gonapodya sp. JEL0774]